LFGSIEGNMKREEGEMCRVIRNLNQGERDKEKGPGRERDKEKGPGRERERQGKETRVLLLHRKFRQHFRNVDGREVAQEEGEILSKFRQNFRHNFVKNFVSSKFHQNRSTTRRER